MTEKEQKFVSAVAAVGDDSEELPRFLDLMSEVFSKRFSQAELILVVTADPSGVSAAVRDYFNGRALGLLVSVVTMEPHTGLETAMNAGRDLAIGDYIFEFDDIHVDYDAAVLSKAWETAISGGFDIVTARNDRPQRLSSLLFYRIYNKMAGEGRSLGPSTFRVLSRRAVNRVKSSGVYIPYRKAVYKNAGLNESSFVYHSLDEEGVTRHSLRRERGDMAFDSFIYFTNLMERVSMAVCLIFFAIAVAVVVYIIVSLVADEHLISGWVSTMGFLSIGFTGLFGLLTIVIKYLSVLVNLSFSRQQYLIKDIEKIAGV